MSIKADVSYISIPPLPKSSSKAWVIFVCIFYIKENAVLFLSDYTDEQLIRLLQEGSEEAFTELFTRHQKRLFLEASFMLGNAEDAHDVLQEIFAYLWNKRKSLHIKNTVVGYLIQGVRYKCIDLIHAKVQKDKKLKKYIEYLKEEPYEKPRAEKAFSLEEYEQIVQSITPYAQSIFYKIYVEEMKQTEIAAEIGVKVQSVRNLINENMKTLRKILKKSL